MKFSLPSQPTWSIYDSSKLDQYLQCPRMFFFEQVLGWRHDIPNHDLYFGECWHLAREHQLLFGYDDIYPAFARFESHYRKVFLPETDSIYIPKTPTGVLSALTNFARTYQRDLIDNRVYEQDGVKFTEISGKVPVSEKYSLHYRMDSIIEQVGDSMIKSWDHKTTKHHSIVQDSWTNQFQLSIQNGTYTHCLYCMFPVERVLGVEFDGVGFEFLSKGSAKRAAGYYSTLKRVQAYKSVEQMNSWLWTVNDLIQNIERDMDRLYHCDDSDSTLAAFRQNPKSCFAYNRQCAYYDFCCTWPNPLRQCHQAPIGFHIEFWDPNKKPASVHKDLDWRR
jgi:hypothetical protein